jgi:hypothetical protein
MLCRFWTKHETTINQSTSIENHCFDHYLNILLSYCGIRVPQTHLICLFLCFVFGQHGDSPHPGVSGEEADSIMCNSNLNGVQFRGNVHGRILTKVEHFFLSIGSLYLYHPFDSLIFLLFLLPHFIFFFTWFRPNFKGWNLFKCFVFWFFLNIFLSWDLHCSSGWTRNHYNIVSLLVTRSHK